MILVNKEEYSKLVKSKSKNPLIVEDAFISFLIGGVMGGAYHILTIFFIDVIKISETSSLSLSCLIFILGAVILTGIGVFDRLVSKFKFGLIIPITGFAHSVTSCLMDYRRDGLITGLGSNMFKLAGSVILYGIISAFFLSILKVIIYG